MGKDKAMLRLESALQRYNQAEQNQWQSNENAIDRQWQEDTWFSHFVKENEEYAKRMLQQFDLQQQQWQTQFDITNAYNDPSAQMSRLTAAGINPAAAIGNSGGLPSLGQSGAIPSSSSPSVAAPSGTAFGSHSVSPASSPSFSGIGQVAAEFSTIAQLASTLQQMSKAGLDIQRQETMLPREVENVVEDTNLKRQKSLLAEIEKNVAFVWSDKKAAADYNKIIADSYAAFTSGDLNKANELLSAANERLSSVQAESHSAQLPQLLANLKELQNVYKSEERKNKAVANASNAAATQSLSSAAYTDEMAKDVRLLRDGKLSEQVLSNAILRTENQLKSRENIRDIQTNEWQVWSIIQAAKKMGYATAEQLERWRIAVKENNSYEMRMILQEINQSIPTAILPIK